jgi:hypothetical protein
MKKSSFSITILIAVLILGVGEVHGETVMIETVDVLEMGELEESRQNVIIQMETGVMDALFDGGHLFFNMYTVNGVNDSKNEMSSLLQAKKTGAHWLVRLQAMDDNVNWKLFLLEDFSLQGEGDVSKDEVSRNHDMTLEQIYFQAGIIAGTSVVNYINR